ncbi:MAG: hypothetical protein Q4G34_00195 [Micrococcus sp.]|nr:hypothetical protein [Micrococcus sp.]
MGRPLVEIEGARQLRATLRKAGDSMEDLKAVHKAAADIAAAEGRRRAPRQSGTLVSTIRTSGTKTGAYVRAGFARVPYPGVQEWGYRTGRPIKGQHFLTTAASATEPQWRELYFRRLHQALNQVKGK